MTTNQIDASIPVLTEIIYPDPATDTLPPSAPNNAISHTEQTPAPFMMETRREITLEEWQAIEQSLRESILNQVLTRIDFVLEHRVRDSLADVLQTAVENLSSEIRTGLHNTLEEVITRAVTQEISKVKISK